MLTVVCFKWKRLNGDSQLAKPISQYTGEHVNKLHNMIWRNLKIPHRFVCITDDFKGIDPRIEIIPLWDKCKNLGGCFNRLYVFSEDMKDIIGERFICIDLDCIIVNDVTSLFTRNDDFIINTYNPFPATHYAINQLYNGGIFMMTAGARKQVWDSFNPKKSPKVIKKNNCVIGTDQAWIRMVLGKNEKTFTEADGVYEARAFGKRIPKNSKIIMFAGPRDPSLSNKPWVVNNWR